MPNRNIFFDQPLPVKTQYEPQKSSVNTSPGIIIPFSMGTSSDTSLTATATGTPTSVVLIGSGKYYSSTLTLTDNTFTQPSNNLYSFIMPYDATLQNIYFSTVFYNDSNFFSNAVTTYTPFVALATATDSNTFTLITETITPVNEPLLPNTQYIANTRLPGSQEELGLSIPAGTKVAILGGLTGSTTGTLFISPVFNGGLWLT